MELKKESIQMLRIKNKAAAQATFDEDYNVPDVKPDIGRLVQICFMWGKKKAGFTAFLRSFRWMR